MVAAPLSPELGLNDVEFHLRDDADLPELMPLSPGQIRVIAGADALSSAFARTTLANSAARRARDMRYAAEREQAFAQYREDELQPPRADAIELLSEAQVDLGRAIDGSVKAEVVSIIPLVQDERGNGASYASWPPKPAPRCASRRPSVSVRRRDRLAGASGCIYSQLLPLSCRFSWPLIGGYL